jgi:hypothetical protein
MASPVAELYDPAAEIAEAVGHLEDVEERLLGERRPDPATEKTHPAELSEISLRRLAWQRQVLDAVVRLSDVFPERIDGYDVRKLLEYTVELGRLIEADPEGHDADGQIDLAKLRVTDVMRRIQRRLTQQHLDDPAAALEFLFGVLATVNMNEIAVLLGTSPKTAAAWKSGSPVRQSARRRRIVLVAQLSSYLRDSLTPHGLVMWFEASREQLGGRSPLAVMGDGDAADQERLLDLARGSRAQLGG